MLTGELLCLRILLHVLVYRLYYFVQISLISEQFPKQVSTCYSKASLFVLDVFYILHF